MAEESRPRCLRRVADDQLDDMHTGNSNFVPAKLFQISFQQYFGRGTGISSLSAGNMEPWPPTPLTQGQKPFPLKSLQSGGKAKNGLVIFLLALKKQHLASVKKSRRIKSSSQDFQHSSVASAVSGDAAERRHLGLC